MRRLTLGNQLELFLKLLCRQQPGIRTGFALRDGLSRTLAYFAGGEPE